jgi:hypothetical protein
VVGSTKDLKPDSLIVDRRMRRSSGPGNSGHRCPRCSQWKWMNFRRQVIDPTCSIVARTPGFRASITGRPHSVRLVFAALVCGPASDACGCRHLALPGLAMAPLTGPQPTVRMAWAWRSGAIHAYPKTVPEALISCMPTTRYSSAPPRTARAGTATRSPRMDATWSIPHPADPGPRTPVQDLLPTATAHPTTPHPRRRSRT